MHFECKRRVQEIVYSDERELGRSLERSSIIFIHMYSTRQQEFILVSFCNIYSYNAFEENREFK